MATYAIDIMQAFPPAPWPDKAACALTVWDITRDAHRMTATACGKDDSKRRLSS
jgi:hypothetical protein